MHGSINPNDTLDYVNVDTSLQRAAAGIGASEAHGVICGLLCVPEAIENPLWLEEVVPDGVTSEQDRDDAKRLLISVAEASRAQLGEDSFEFYPLLPEDEFPLQSRGRALAQWCAGFLFGLSIAGAGDLDALPADSREIVGDLSKFAGIRGGGRDEEEENAYAELVEYIRVGVMLINQELGGQSSSLNFEQPLH